MLISNMDTSHASGLSMHMTSDPLVSRILGRSESLFAADVHKYYASLQNQISDLRILVIGASGAVGNSFVNQLAPYRPAQLDLVDISENGLVEVVRDLRSSGAAPENFRTFCIDMRNKEFNDFLTNTHEYDVVLNFAALKHVRSERDPYTLMRLLDTNVLAVDRLLQHLRQSSKPRFFSVSTDKSVRPANLMGASKAMMEKVMWSHSDAVTVTSSRFANVAFSAGSLLEGFGHRLAKLQPLAAPNDVRRYFISHEEAGHLCLMAAFLGENCEVVVPGFSGVEESMTFSEIAELFLHFHGFAPRYCQSEAEARDVALELVSKVRNNQAVSEWPCLFLPSNTSGEKDLEEFHVPGDFVDRDRYKAAHVVQEKMPDNANGLRDIINELDAIGKRGIYDIALLSSLVHEAVPDFEHIVSDKTLDSKM